MYLNVWIENFDDSFLVTFELSCVCHPIRSQNKIDKKPLLKPSSDNELDKNEPDKEINNELVAITKRTSEQLKFEHARRKKITK